MDCKRLEANLGLMSAGACDEQTVQAAREHCERCEKCAHVMHCFERALQALDETHQLIPTPQQSRAMWLECEKCFAQNHEVVRPFNWRAWLSVQPRWGWYGLGSAAVALGAAFIFSPNATAPNATSPASGEPQFARVSQGVTLSPSAEYSGMSGARPIAAGIREESPLQFLASGEGRVQAPPQESTHFIAHHAVMGFDPFADHVGASSISHSAAPSAR